MNLPAPAKAAGGLLGSLQRSELYRSYHGAFEHTIGLPLDLKRPDSFRFPLDGSRHQNRFCVLMAARNRSCATCLQVQQRLHDEATTETKTLECSAGLSESAVPVRVGESVVGLLRTGQVFLTPPSKQRLDDALREGGFVNGSPEAADLELAYFRSRVMSAAQYSAALSLLRIFAQHLAVLAKRLLIEQANAELPEIGKARTFMEQNLAEELRLEDVAHAASMSPFYFCKLFSRVTGLTFTQYLARLRIDVVKQKLLNPNVQVCEVAYATGFQSLSQFNRVFRRVAGETPSAYRDRLHVDVCRERRS